VKTVRCRLNATNVHFCRNEKNRIEIKKYMIIMIKYIKIFLKYLKYILCVCVKNELITLK